MKKRHLLGLFAMAAFAFVSCSQDEVVSQSPDVNKAIEFGTYVGRDASSRASEIKIENLAIKGFGVFAYHTTGNFVEGDDQNTTDVEVASSCNFMFNQLVHGKKGGTTEAPTYATDSWEYSPLKYWPNNTSDKLTFFAYAPYEAGSNGNIILPSTAPEGVPSLTFNVGTDVEKHQDLLFTLPQLNKVNNNSSVDFAFEHALARIGFKAEVSDELDEYTTITIKKVELIGKFYSKGTMSLKDGSWSPESQSNNITFKLESTANDFADEGNIFGKDNITERQLNSNNNYIMIIPQDFTVNGIDSPLQMIVEYNVFTDLNKDGNKDVNDSMITNTITSQDFKLNFSQGTAYSLSIVIGMASIKFSASVADWGDEEETEIVWTSGN